MSASTSPGSSGTGPSGPLRRFKGGSPCPICGGHDGRPRGKGERCHGFLSADGRYAHCSREERAGGLRLDEALTYSHLLGGPCRCGETHLCAPELEPARTPRDHALLDGEFGRCPSPYPCDYHDEHNKILYRVARWRRGDGSKTYSIHHPDGQGRWLAGRGDARRVLYGLAVVREGMAKGEAIHITEGEKKVHMLLERRFYATCCDGGAGKFTLAHRAGYTVGYSLSDSSGGAFLAHQSQATIRAFPS